MPIEERRTGDSATKLLQRLESSQAGDALRQHARRRGLEVGGNFRAAWEKKIRLLLLVRGRLPDQEWIEELERFKRKWSNSKKPGLTEFSESLGREPISTWLEPIAIRVWMREQRQEALTPFPNLLDPRPLESEQREGEESHEHRENAARIQAAFLSGLLEAILMRDVTSVTPPRMREVQ